MHRTVSERVRRLVYGGAVWGMTAGSLPGCGIPRTGPVEIFPEDACATCRMAFSDHRFAGEIIDGDGGVYKFDDIACMEAFRSAHAGVHVDASYVMEYDTKSWIESGRAVVVTTGVASPMGSGKVAFSDSTRAFAFLKEHPVIAAPVAEERAGCCSDGTD